MKTIISKLLIILVCFTRVYAEQLDFDQSNTEAQLNDTNRMKREYHSSNFEAYLNQKYFSDGCGAVESYTMQISSVHDLRLVSEEMPKKNLEHVSTNCIINRNEFQQEAQTSGYKRTITQTRSIAISFTQEVSGTVKIPTIPYLDSISLKISHSRTTTESVSDSVEKSVLPQKVRVEPQSKVSVIYKLYTNTIVHHYLIDFEISQDSKIRFNAGKREGFWSFFCPPHRFYADRNLLDELNSFNSKPISDNIKIEYESGKWILKNLPFKLETVDAELKVTFGQQTKLTDYELQTISDESIKC